MSPNGRRAWREWVRRQNLRRKHKQPKGSVCRMARQARRHIPLVPGVVLPNHFTARSLVGMSMGARKRAAWYEALRTSYDGDGGPISNRKLRLCLRSALTVMVLAVTVPIEWRLEVRAKYRIGERVRPCPGCPKCTDNPLRIVRALSRRMQLRFEIRRCNSSINPGKFDYLAMLHRSGPTWNPVCGFGPTQNDAVRALCDVILREGAEEFVIASCDGSGVLPARRSNELHRR